MPAGQVLGIEGTAWNLSAGTADADGLGPIHSHAFKPASGGIHPRDAAQHHASVVVDVIRRALEDVEELRGVAFSQGPGLGPCLRTVATAARSLALRFGVPLVGVNHCVAHIEIGRYTTGCKDPVILYASGANTQVLGFLRGRYRIFGETLDIGLGNALDKFARSKGLPHPGGPQIERLALGGEYIPLPYTVKGMDLAFSGLVSAAREMERPLEDVCCSLQETAFAMCVEVTERALAHAGKDEVLLVGGVGANSRLQEMLRCMCEERGAQFFVPEEEYLGDNGAMIAYLGRLMLDAGIRTPIEESQILPGFRADQVEVLWRSDLPSRSDASRFTGSGRCRGAEAEVTRIDGRVVKNRLSKRYRNPGLDRRLITERTRSEARLIAMARRAGVPTPVISDITERTIEMEAIDGTPLRERPQPELLREAGRVVGRLHAAGIVHGDLTTSNIIERNGSTVLIDFGLARVSSEIEQQGVDLHVLFQTLESTAPDPAGLIDAFIRGYREAFPGADEVIAREREIDRRGRYL
ncbi:MAG: bifunctional N(6)-L-threonylcarbamoyladenine synthase/serine/threonine protein kinase [Methanoculleaceae archaeon]